MRYSIQIGERGRLVLPAALRRALDVADGAYLVVDLEGDTLRVTKAADVARAAQGLFRDVAPGRSLADELLAERRDEAEREAVPGSAR